MNNFQPLEQFCQQHEIPFFCQEPMEKHTTFRIGGPADFFAAPSNEKQLALLVGECSRLGWKPFFTGKGSNLLVKDEGIRGVVVSTAYMENDIELLEEEVIRCGAGTSLAAVCQFALSHSLTGLEFAWGIPGSVGGAVFMNAGAYGREIKDALVSVTHLLPDGNKEELPQEKLELSYRHSMYENHPELCISQAVLRLQKGEPEAIRQKMEEYKTKRRANQPLEFPSAGSTFKRPAGGYAAAMIDECGLKGLTVGGAMVSPKHAGFVVNKGGATCRDVLALMEQVRAKVLEEKGVLLECEIRIPE